ncbi:MAG: hypothetical protein K8H88_31095, partial [Sandaracinaceae bacterium]|nr:hypothetical protein [Sandaracinaceae bacterium]
MAAPLTLAELRNLSRLHRAGVEGAEAQLRAIIDERAVDLPVLLGFPEENLARLREADAPVELLLR